MEFQTMCFLSAQTRHAAVYRSLVTEISAAKTVGLGIDVASEILHLFL